MVWDTAATAIFFASLLQLSSTTGAICSRVGNNVMVMLDYRRIVWPLFAYTCAWPTVYSDLYKMFTRCEYLSTCLILRGEKMGESEYLQVIH